jgi:hypothetical protein
MSMFDSAVVLGAYAGTEIKHFPRYDQFGCPGLCLWCFGNAEDHRHFLAIHEQWLADMYYKVHCDVSGR